MPSHALMAQTTQNHSQVWANGRVDRWGGGRAGGMIEPIRKLFSDCTKSIQRDEVFSLTCYAL